MLVKWHYPAPGMIALGLIMDHAELFHLFERLVPKMQMQDLRLARQQVVADREPLHRVEDALDIAGRYIFSQISGLVSAGLDQMQDLDAFFLQFFVCLVLDTDLCVEVPAVVIESLTRCGKLFIKSFYIIQIHVLDE